MSAFTWALVAVGLVGVAGAVMPLMFVLRRSFAGRAQPSIARPVTRYDRSLVLVHEEVERLLEGAHDRVRRAETRATVMVAVLLTVTAAFVTNSRVLPGWVSVVGGTALLLGILSLAAVHLQQGVAGEISEEWLADVAGADPDQVRVSVFNAKVVLLASAERDAGAKQALVGVVLFLVALAVPAGVVYVIVAARGG